MILDVGYRKAMHCNVYKNLAGPGLRFLTSDLLKAS